MSVQYAAEADATAVAMVTVVPVSAASGAASWALYVTDWPSSTFSARLDDGASLPVKVCSLASAQ